MPDSNITLDQFAAAMDLFMPPSDTAPSRPFQEQCRFFPNSPGAELLPRYLKHLSQAVDHAVQVVVLEIPAAPTRDSSTDYIARAFLEQLGQTEKLRSDSYVLRLRLQKYFEQHEVYLLILTGWDNLLTPHQHKVMPRAVESIRSLLHSELPKLYVLAIADLDAMERVFTSSFQMASMFSPLLPLPPVESAMDTRKRKNEMARPTKGASTQSQEISLVTVEYHWIEPDQPPQGMFKTPDPDEPFMTRELITVPELEEFVTLTLPFPQFHGLRIPPSPVHAHGQVKTVNMNRDHTHAKVTLERQGRVGLNWYELGACIGATMIAYLPPFGRIEGTLESLFPSAELAELAVPGLGDVTDQYIALLENRGVDIAELFSDEEDSEEDDTDEEATDLIWVPWSALWLKGGVQAMQEQAHKSSKHRPQTSNRE